MSTNAEIAGRLGQIAELLELTGADKFRVLANQKAARVIESLTAELGPIARGPDARTGLMALEGIGPKIADKIIELCATGRIKELEELKAAVPAGLPEVMSIPGMGPKTVRLVWQEAGVTDLAGLKRIIDDGSILNLPRMGAKAVEKLKASIAMLAESRGRLGLGVAMPVAERVVALMKDVKGVEQAAFAGSLRRGKESIGDIDILVAAKGAAVTAAAEAFCTMPGVRHVIARGEAKCSVRVSLEEDGGRFSGAPTGDAGEAANAAPTDAERAGGTVQVDLRVIEPARWGSALMYFTGSKEHNVRLRQRALDRGLTLNEYGLFPEDKSTSESPQSRGVKAVASKTEEEIFKALELPWVPPELREDRGELKLESTPVLIEVADIRAELHSHTTASDGTMSIEELAERAKARGFHTIAVTDHSKSQGIANGLSAARLEAHIEAIHAARAKVKGITILAGSEVDIFADGSLDYEDKLLAKLDLVVASPHAALSQDPERATERLLKAIAHPRVHILSHPTGRLVLRRRGLEPDMAKVFAAAKKHGVALEINAHWMRLDLRDTHVHAALEAGCVLAINCDVHSPGDFDNLRFGVLTGRRGGLTKERCVNCWAAEELRAWIKGKGHG